MPLDLQIARLVRILVDKEGITFEEAQRRLKSLTLEIIVGQDAKSPAAHSAVLTAIAVGRRTFVGGVKVTGYLNQPLNTALPIRAASLGEAAIQIGAADYRNPPSRTIFIGSGHSAASGWSTAAWWNGWTAGTSDSREMPYSHGANPLPGIAAGALSVGKAFDAERGVISERDAFIDLWPTSGTGEQAPCFSDVYLPGAVWMVGIGNLGQAYLWALTALPYADPASVSLVLQDMDRIDERNWSTSVLVNEETYGSLKTRVGENWALAKGFLVRRLDRFLEATDHLSVDDPRVALSGLDRILPRKIMSNVGFDCIVDAGLGRTSHNFDTYRVSVFDSDRTMAHHFDNQNDSPESNDVPDDDSYKLLESDMGQCGAAEVAGAAVAAPYVSAVAATVAISRLIAVTSGCMCSSNVVDSLSTCRRTRIAPLRRFDASGSSHAGRPRIDVASDAAY